MKIPMHKMIINADDYGLDLKKTDETLLLIKNGLVTSVSIMANGQYTLYAARKIKNEQNVSIGVHLCLTEGAPLLKNQWSNQKLLNNNDDFIFNRPNNFLLRHQLLLFRELSAQIDYIKSFDIKISHLDSHHHIHTKPGLLLVLVLLSRKYKITKIRNSRNIEALIENSKVSKLKILKKRLWVFILKRLFKVTLTDYFGNMNDLTRINQRKIGLNKPKVLELAIHPGHDKSVVFQKEVEFLRSHKFNKISSSFSLVSYEDI
jgi:chitin disaccharide deacetylase